MIRRYLKDKILYSLKYFPVVFLTGARQVGKSTLAQEIVSKSWRARYVTLDERAILDAALRDPDGLASSFPPPVIFDEVQRAPDLLRAIKRIVDRDRKPGQFLLTGSANILTLSKVAETLAGRTCVHTLYPFSWPEIKERPKPDILKQLFKAKNAQELLAKLNVTSVMDMRAEIKKEILSGGYPVPALMDSARSRWEWFSAYKQTYLERDIISLKAIENLPDFNRLLTLAALRTGRLLNLSDFSREVGLPFTTLRRYMNMLEVTYQIFLLPPYYAHPAKRLIKMPKIFFNDTGMACYLMGTDDWSLLEKQGQTGALVETWVASELKKLISFEKETYNLSFWRTYTGQEIDFIIEKANKVIALEVKWGFNIGDEVMKNFEYCATALREKFHLGVVIYGGTEVVPLSRKIVALPFPVFFGLYK